MSNSESYLFSHNISIHGISDLAHLQPAQRFVWISCMMTVLAFACYNSWSMVDELRKEPITTYVRNYEGNQQYPTITVCPTHLKYNQTKAKEHFRKYHADRYQDKVLRRMKWGEHMYTRQYCDVEKTTIVRNDCYEEITYGCDQVIKDDCIEEITPACYDAIWNLDHDMNDDIYNWFLMYLSTYETMNYFKGIVGQSQLVTATNSSPGDPNSESQIDDMISAFWKQLGNRPYEEVELDLTIDFVHAVVEKPGYPIRNQRKVMTTYGTCYAFEVAPNMDMGNPRNFLATGNRLEFALPRNPDVVVFDYHATDLPGDANADFIFFGETGFWPKSSPQAIQQAHFKRADTTGNSSLYSFNSLIGYNTVEVRADFKYDILISSITFNRLNLRRRPCRDWSEHDRSICMVQCYNDEMCSNIDKPCLIFHPNQTASEQYDHLCSWLKTDDNYDMYYLSGKHPHCILHEEVLSLGTFNELCDSRCPIRCTEELFFVTHASQQMISPYIKNADHRYCGVKWANITVRYQDPHRKLLIQEHKLWRRDTFAANFASSVSVWIGVSGLSFVQFGMILIGSIWNRKQKNKEFNGVNGAFFVCTLMLYFAVLCAIFGYLFWTLLTM